MGQEIYARPKKNPTAGTIAEVTGTKLNTPDQGTKTALDTLPHPRKANAIKCKKNEVTTTRSLVETPEETTRVKIKNISTDTVWLGDVTVTADGDTSYPLQQNESITLDLAKDNENTIYAITASGTSYLYVIGEFLDG